MHEIYYKRVTIIDERILEKILCVIFLRAYAYINKIYCTLVNELLENISVLGFYFRPR